MSGDGEPVRGFVMEMRETVDPETGEVTRQDSIREVADINAVFDEERG